jgi:type IV secretion system protein VirB9
MAMTVALSICFQIALAAHPAAAQDYMSQNISLTPKEEEALRLAAEWSDRPIKPIQTAEGKVVYVHGATLPTIIGSPMQISDIELEPGEQVNEILVGDSARWLVEDGTSGNGITHIFVKPVDAGLSTSLAVTTNRRVYHIKLISRVSGHTPYVGFLYSGQMQALVKKDARESQWRTAMEDNQPLDMSNLNFNYDVRGKAAWKPVKVWDDGRKMYLRLPDKAVRGEVPALLVRRGDENILVNYRLKNNTFEVDGIFNNIILIAGNGGNQDRAEIIRGKDTPTANSGGGK